MFGEAQRAAVLDSAVYREVAADEAGTMEVLQVVLLVAVASGAGGMIGALMLRRPSALAMGAFMFGFVGTLVGWVVWGLATYVVGKLLFGGQAGFGALLRAEGYALRKSSTTSWLRALQRASGRSSCPPTQCSVKTGVNWAVS
ncbi:MAG TPA: hypothetical protein VFB73_08470 [Chloroflexota bacterium]|nr:hypothetical protein [Chloroflexota bacterium]